MSSDSEQDLALKLRTMRYLWNLNYFVRRNIPIMEQQSANRQYTDIDVLAVKVADDLSADLLVCDCKSGTQAKTRERFFWLAGVMKFFGVSRGLFIRSKLLGSNYLELADKLEIIPLSEEQLQQLEDAYNVDRTDFFGPFSKESTESDKILSLLRQFAPDTAEYLRSIYWTDIPAEQITNLVACCKRIKALQEIDERAKNFLLTYALSLLSLSIVRLSRGAIILPEVNRGEFVRVELLGGRTEHETRGALLGGFYNFMTKEIEQRYNAKYPISKLQFLESLTPPYSKYIADLVARLCRNPRYYAFLPRALDLIAFDAILAKKPFNIQNLMTTSIYFDPKAISKPMTDFLTMADRSGLLTPELLQSLKDQMNSIA